MFRGVILLFNQCFELAKIFFIISIVCFAPQILFREHKKPAPTLLGKSTNGAFKLGIENVTAEYISQICAGRAPRIGLITQYGSHDKAENIVLLKSKGIEVAQIFYPTYDYFSNDIIDVGLKSLNSSIPSCVIKKDGFNDELKDISLLLIDLQNIGLGCVSSISLLFQGLSAAAKDKIPVVVLDRPNILGNKIEGSLLSNAGLNAQVPLRYGMTVAELAHYYNMHILHKEAQLHIVPMHNYDRLAVRQEIDVNVLPKINNITTAWGFSVCGILAQVKPFDVGLDTDNPYRCIALPKSVIFPEQKWYQLQVVLRDVGIDSSICRYYSKKKKESCRGLRLYIEDMNTVDSFQLLLTTLEFFKRSGVILHFTDDFDQAVGSTLVRKYIQGKIPRHVLAQSVNQGLENFYRKAFGAFMYHPLPQVVLV
ncbi:MAG: exo-beta-N-acetylmuramidase NamZ domain-containing protein [Candidatus Dependentiae bacterium]